MASDFFERQDAARRNTTRLVILFALAVLALVVSVDLILAATLGYLARDPRTGGIEFGAAGTPEVLLFATVATLAVVGGGTLFKVAQLRGGGHVVAEQLGGRRLSADTTDPAERQLLNVVDEMAIAAGIPAPPVYLLSQETGINAFAAGFTPADAVIGVTRGTIAHLTRDELQGVIAHEFSHILNGDMRLNVRLIGLLHGILIIGLIGYFLLRSAVFAGPRARRGRDGGNQLPLLALGAGLMAAGFFGTFFGNLIKASVSRQREFLADASAVQFTRQPAGIAGALKKIGGAASGSAIGSPRAPEASHMFFGRATGGLSALFSTHPPLAERIRRIDPAWDGEFPEVEAAPLRPGTVAPAAAGFAGAEPPPARAGTATAAGLITQVGQPTEAHLAYAARLVRTLPAPVAAAAREPYGARAVVYALLLDREDGARAAQASHLRAAADPGVLRELSTLAPLVDRLDRTSRLPLMELALPALRQLTAGQYGVFRQNVDVLVRADASIDLFEWALQRIVIHDLDRQFARVPPPRVRHRDLGRVLPHAAVLLSALAHVGARAGGSPQAAFEAGRQALGAPAMTLGPPDACGLDAVDAALAALEETTPDVKRRVLQAAAACVSADRRLTGAEAELLRAIAASLGCPMPPLTVAA